MKLLPDSLSRLAQDHVDMRLALNVLEREVDAVAQYHEADSDVLGGGVQYFAKFPARCHHPIEDAIHKALSARTPAAAERAVCTTRHDQLVERIGEFAMMMRNLFLDAPRWRVPFCTTARAFIVLKRGHIREEENIFFRLALENLLPEDWAAIDLASQKAHSAWTGDPANLATYDVLGFRAERGARASGSVRRS